VARARVILRVAGYARAFRRFKPNAVIAFVPYTNLAAAYARPLSRHRFGLAVSEHAHVTASLRDPESFSGAFLWFYRRRFAAIYNDRADLVKCIAEESRRDLIDNHGIEPARTRLIYNPVDMDEISHLAAEPVEHPWFSDSVPIVVNVGRLKLQKRQEVLIEAFARVRRRRRVRLALVGRGGMKESLVQCARDLGVLDDVLFLGFQRNPWKYMKRASLLAMSSEWEGLPCVLTEAMSLRVPIVSTRCPSGPAEMLCDGRAGLLVPVADVSALADGIERILEDGNGARERVEEAYANLGRFRPEHVTRQYEALACELADRAA
jgi:glycosyltransferase involved in cell wall biosynthesis